MNRSSSIVQVCSAVMILMSMLQCIGFEHRTSVAVRGKEIALAKIGLGQDDTSGRLNEWDLLELNLQSNFSD